MRHIADNDVLQDVFPGELSLARRVLTQKRYQHRRKVYSLHAPELESIGHGKAHPPCELDVKVSVATPVKHSDRERSFQR